MYSYKKRRRNTDTDTEEDSHKKTEAVVGVMLPQAKEHLGLPEARRGKEGSSPRAFRESMALSKP